MKLKLVKSRNRRCHACWLESGRTVPRTDHLVYQSGVIKKDINTGKPSKDRRDWHYYEKVTCARCGKEEPEGRVYPWLLEGIF